jgi:hypothetical protein
LYEINKYFEKEKRDWENKHKRQSGERDYSTSSEYPF